jgi:UDP-galactopyranose mutase
LGTAGYCHYRIAMRIRIIGAGLSGATAAILLAERGHSITVYDSRNHIGGNCYDSNIAGTLVHNYGPHLFHTNDEDVFTFLSRYTDWFEFKNQPKGNTKLGMISLPYSKKTIKEIGRELSQEEIVDVIFKDYSEKQWGVPFEQIPKSITNRVPKTKDCDDPTWYEGEKYQCLPRDGYTKMFERMLDGVNVVLGDKNDAWRNEQADFTVYTGKIDQYFNYCYGALPYRSLKFKHETSSLKLEHAIINQNNKANEYTRVYDHSFFNFKHTGSTIITREYPKQCGENDTPFYPIPFGDGLRLYSKYKELADKEENTVFLGRLATYTYLDMWMAVKQAMIKINNLNI